MNRSNFPKFLPGSGREWLRQFACAPQMNWEQEKRGMDAKKDETSTVPGGWGRSFYVEIDPRGDNLKPCKRCSLSSFTWGRGQLPYFHFANEIHNFESCGSCALKKTQVVIVVVVLGILRTVLRILRIGLGILRTVLRILWTIHVLYIGITTIYEDCCGEPPPTPTTGHQSLSLQTGSGCCSRGGVRTTKGHQSLFVHSRSLKDKQSNNTGLQ